MVEYFKTLRFCFVFLGQFHDATNRSASAPNDLSAGWDESIDENTNEFLFSPPGNSRMWLYHSTVTLITVTCLHFQAAFSVLPSVLQKFILCTLYLIHRMSTFFFFNYRKIHTVFPWQQLKIVRLRNFWFPERLAFCIYFPVAKEKSRQCVTFALV